MKLSVLAFLFASLAHGQTRIEITFPASLHAGPITGRAFVTFNPPGQQNPSFRMAGPFFAQDIDSVQPGTPAIIDSHANGYPILSLKDLPPGDYSVQAMICPYTEFHRADGHTMWAHMDQWEGQSPESAPGNLYSAPRTIHVDPASSATIPIALTQTMPPVNVPPDTDYVKHIKIQSELLTKFWGQPMYIGATVLLPRDYGQHPEQHYPAVYNVFHFSLGAPFGFNSTGPTGFSKDWLSDNYPRAIAVTFQHPTVYYDDSYAANSPNHGPYGDALTRELIPYLEAHFRMIPEVRARTVTGGSTGGWEALALQVYYPDVFGGAWVFCPDSIDFTAYGILNIYNDENAFLRPGVSSVPHPIVGSEERPMLRTPDGQPTRTFREQTLYEDAIGGKSRSGGQLAGWDAVWSPVGDDGYPEASLGSHNRQDR